MDRVEIQRVINRINQIEAEIDSKIKLTNHAFHTILQAAMGSQTSFEEAKNQASIPIPQIPFSIPNNVLINPNQLVPYRGHAMTLKTAGAFRRLEDLLARAFPRRPITITNTTEQGHGDPNHASGKAVDFMVEGLTKAESRILEDLSRQAGFMAYNHKQDTNQRTVESFVHIVLAT